MRKKIINNRFEAGGSILHRGTIGTNCRIEPKERNIINPIAPKLYIFVAPFFVKTTCHN